jgi:hypothetical protein
MAAAPITQDKLEIGHLLFPYELLYSAQQGGDYPATL